MGEVSIPRVFFQHNLRLLPATTSNQPLKLDSCSTLKASRCTSANFNSNNEFGWCASVVKLIVPLYFRYPNHARTLAALKRHDFLSIAYKNVVGARRVPSYTIPSIKRKEESRSTSLDLGEGRP